MIKNALVTDLDNTLFDWVNIWHQSFSAMMDEVLEVTGFPADDLYSEVSTVHTRHGTSEYSFLLEEVPSLVEFCNGRSVVEVFSKAIDRYREERRRHLKLYPNVAETLLSIKGRGALIVGYTESMAFYSNYRIRRLGLDGVLDYVFCPVDHKIPNNVSPTDIRKYPSEKYKLRYTEQHYTPEGVLMSYPPKIGH